MPVSATGAISVYTESGTNFLVDVVGWFGNDPNALPVPLGLFQATNPDRLIDTRTGVGANARVARAGGTVAVQAAGRAGLPSTGVLGIAGTLTVTESAGVGFLTAFPNSAAMPSASTLKSDRASQTVANAVMLGLSADGKFGVFTSTDGQVIADVFGYVG